MPTYHVKALVGDALVGSSYFEIMELGERLRFGRNRQKLTQQAVADRFGVSRPTVTQWELGTHRPDQDKFVGLAELFGVPLAWLMDGSGPAPGAKATASNQKPADGRPARFLRTTSFRFYIKDWREFMGVKIGPAAEAAGLPPNEYQAHETHPINFTLGQVASLAGLIGVRGDQFWFPPPKAPITKPLSNRVTKPGTRRGISLSKR